MRAPLALLYGLRIRSEVPIRQARPVTDDADADLELTLGAPMPLTFEAPPGTTLAELHLAGSHYHFARSAGGGYVLRYFGACDFVVDPDLRRAEARLVEGADPDLVAVLAAGSLPSFVLMMRGDPLLHASAVDVGGGALAFVGGSGMGKSTMATLSCAAGGKLITDDVLRLDVEGPVPRCHLGSGELRLRKAATELAARFPAPPRSRRTGDDRTALQVEMATTDLLPLAAIVVPRPVRHRDETELRRLDPIDALLTLSGFPRLVGWEDPETHALQFHHLATICEQISVYEADVPWGPPFPPGVAQTIFEAVGVTAGDPH
jgi:hypothetical protein